MKRKWNKEIKTKEKKWQRKSCGLCRSKKRNVFCQLLSHFDVTNEKRRKNWKKKVFFLYFVYLFFRSFLFFFIVVIFLFCLFYFFKIKWTKTEYVDVTCTAPMMTNLYTDDCWRTKKKGIYCSNWQSYKTLFNWQYNGAKSRKRDKKNFFLLKIYFF